MAAFIAYSASSAKSKVPGTSQVSRFRFIPCVLLLALYPTLSAFADVELVPLQPSEAAESGALSFACSAAPDELANFFIAHQAPFETALVRDRNGSACHVFYQPTLQGFRASRDNETPEGLYSSISPYSFLANSEIPGDSLEIVKEILSRLSRPLDILLTVSGGFSQSLWEPAAVRHFGGLPHHFRFFESGDSVVHPWAQDHLKAGYVNGLPQVLIPRRLYQEDADGGATTESLFESLEALGYVRSKLSWQGSALQFVADPRDASKTILVAGGAFRDWGRELSAAEYSYVLRQEFGADEFLDLGDGPRADSLVAFLPDDNSVLVSQMMRGDTDVARAAAFQLLETFSASSPPPAVRRLASLLAEWDGDLREGSTLLSETIDSAQRAIEAAAPEDDPGLNSLLKAYVASHCPGNPATCFDQAREQEVLETDPELLRRSSSHAAVNLLRTRLRAMLLGIVRQQTDRSSWPEELAVDQFAAQLESRGFHVVRVPYLRGGSQPSVSYANALLIDKKLFLPTLGLRRYEERTFSQLRRDLEGRYQVIPVDARTALTRRGGVRRAFAVFRRTAQ